MKKKLLTTFSIVLLLMMSIAFGNILESATTPNQFSEGINPEWKGDSFAYTTSDSFFGNNPAYTYVTSSVSFYADNGKFSRFCDIDKDGKKEIISYSGNTITIRGFNNAELEIESSFSVTSQTADDDTINSLACVDMSGDGEDYYNIVIHQGQVNGSSEIAFIEYQPDWVSGGTALLEVEYGESGYYLNGYYENVQDITNHISCSPISSGWGDASESYPRNICGITNGEDVTLFTLSAFTGTGDNQRFPILDCATEECFYGNFGVGGIGGTYGMSDFVIATSGSSTRSIIFRQSTTIKSSTWVSGSGFSSPTTLPDIYSQYNRVYFAQGDFENDGVMEVCVHGGTDALNPDYSRIQCWDSGLTSVVYQAQYSGQDNEIPQPTFYDYDQDGDKEIFYYNYMKSATDTLVMSGSTDYFQTSTSVQTGGLTDAPRWLSFTRLEGTNKTLMAMGKYVVTINKTNSTTTYEELTEFTNPTASFFIDLDNDLYSEYVNYDLSTGAITIYSNSEPSTSTLTIELVKTNVVGDGYYGFYPNSCEGNISFSAIECVDGQTDDCTYVASSETSQERICTTCGGTQSFFCGDYSFANPQVTCDLSAGSYEIDLAIESTSKSGFYQAIANPDIPFDVVSGVEGIDCNVLGTFYDSPNQLPNDNNDDGIDDLTGIGGVIDNGGDTNDETSVGVVLTGIQNLHPVFKFLIAGLIIIGLAVWTSNNSNGNQLLSLLAGFIGIGVSVVLGLISLQVVIIAIVVMMIVMGLLHKVNTPSLST